jgi:hypothetical protein
MCHPSLQCLGAIGLLGRAGSGMSKQSPNPKTLKENTKGRRQAALTICAKSLYGSQQSLAWEGFAFGQSGEEFRFDQFCPHDCDNKHSYRG